MKCSTCFFILIFPSADQEGDLYEINMANFEVFLCVWNIASSINHLFLSNEIFYFMYNSLCALKMENMLITNVVTTWIPSFPEFRALQVSCEYSSLIFRYSIFHQVSKAVISKTIFIFWFWKPNFYQLIIFVHNYYHWWNQYYRDIDLIGN